MKIVLTLICLLSLIVPTAFAASTVCKVGSAVVVDELADGNKTHYIEIICPKVLDVVPGTEVKIRIQKPKTTAIEGC